MPARYPVGLVLLALLLSGADARSAIHARLLQQPDVSQTQIAFVYAGDIWLVAKSGGTAQRLSTPPGVEAFPRFSPDGSQIAYSAEYDGNSEIYVIPVTGGIPTRVTYHPAEDRLIDWYPDGRSLLFASSRESGKQRFSQLYRIDARGGLPEKLPLPYGEFGAIAPDGKTLAYLPLTDDFRTWKRYRGGMASEIWTFDLVTHRSKNISNSPATDTQPMWYGSTLFFASDRDEALRSNLWAYDTKLGSVRQLTHYTDHDIHFPAIGPAEIVFENAGRLRLLDLTTGKVREVAIEVVTDRATLKPQVKKVGEMLQAVDLSPKGKRVVVQARGDLFTIPAENGVTFNLTRSSGVAERFPAWSPDGKELAYWSDRSGEYELVVRGIEPGGEERTLTQLGPGFRYRPTWSPDGKKLAFVDQAMRIRLFDRDEKKVVDVDRALYFFEGNLDGFRVSWSADSRWMAYTRDLEQGHAAIFLWDSEKGERHQITSGFYDVAWPVFDPAGKYLYLVSNQSYQPSYGNLDNTWVYNNLGRLAAIPLRTDVPSPTAPRNDTDAVDDKKDEKKDEKKDDAKDEAAKPEPVKIDIEGLERRLVLLPPKAGYFTEIYAVTGKLLYRRPPRTGSGLETSPVLYWDLDKREEKTILETADGVRLSADGQTLLAVKENALFLVKVEPDQKLEKPLPIADLEMEVDPAAEWRQIFNDVWRFERDYFYDPNLHGVDWAEMRKRYGALIDDAVTRRDVNFVIGELIAELNASHTYRGGGDTEKPFERGIGLLGCDFKLEQGAYRITKIIDGASWDSEVRSPLLEPGAGIKEGNWLLAVNGAPLETTKEPWAALAGLAGKPVMLTVNDKPTREGARDVLVQTIADESRLRNLAWIEGNRQRVERATDGRVGYLYVPDTGTDGQTELYRMFVAQQRKDGLIIDERFNDGGQIPDRFIELLNRPIYNYWGVRDGRDWRWPPVSHVGPKAMLINQWSGSGGDCFPYYFREAGLGPLIGMRTWGGLIGISGSPGLIDNGGVTVPTFGFYNTRGEWDVENHGVDPDIEVVDDPALMLDGGDPQLDRAIAEVLKALRERPPTQPAKPKYPVKSGR